MARLLVALMLVFATMARAEENRPLMGLAAEPTMLPVTIAGNPIVLDSYVVRPDHPGRFPLVILVHGTPDAQGAAEFAAALAHRSPVGFDQVAVAFAERGYAAVSIMRRGFGRSDGGYAERLAKPCEYLPAVRNSADDVLAAIEALRAKPWIDPNRILLLGLSTGGLAVMAAGARNPQGVVGVINFDGGRHGLNADGQACGPQPLVDTVAALGRTARIPVLWVYAKNDLFYGPELAGRMIDAYRQGGAPAELRLLEPFGSNGHDTVVEAPADRWFPAIAPFISQRGLPDQIVLGLAPLAALQPPAIAVQVCQGVFARYAALRWDNKAFALSARGGCGSAEGRTLDEARAAALASCAAHTHGAACSIYALGQHLASE